MLKIVKNYTFLGKNYTLLHFFFKSVVAQSLINQGFSIKNYTTTLFFYISYKNKIKIYKYYKKNKRIRKKSVVP